MVDQEILKNIITNKKVAIIGPSPHLIKKNQGNLIDSYDVVIRINELGVDKTLWVDYGSKTDIVFLTLTNESTMIYEAMKKELDIKELKLVVHPRDEFNFDPDKKIRDDMSIFQRYEFLNLNKSFLHIEKPSFEERYKFFNCSPSTGSLAIFQILEYDFEELYIAGFSFYTTKYKWNKKKFEFERLSPLHQDGHNIRMSGHNIKEEILGLKKIIQINKSKNIKSDLLFKKIVKSKTMIYFNTRRFLVYYVNIDNFKNQVKIFLRYLKSL